MAGDPISRADILAKLFARLTGDTALNTALGGRIYNTAPQADANKTDFFPYLRFSIGSSSADDSNTTQGFTQTLVFDIWVSSDGDKEVMEIADKLNAALHDLPLTLANGVTSVCLQHLAEDVFYESDGASHHMTTRYLHIVST